MIFADPSRLWLLSVRLRRRGFKRLARLIKLYNFVVFKAILPPEAELSGLVNLGHYALNIVVHPNTTIGNDVILWHSVTLSVTDSPGSTTRLIIGNRVVIGTGSVLLTPLRESAEICSDVVIGANSVVTKSIADPGVYAGTPAKMIRLKAS